MCIHTHVLFPPGILIYTEFNHILLHLPSLAFFPLLEHYSYIFLILKFLGLGCRAPPGACVSLRMLQASYPQSHKDCGGEDPDTEPNREAVIVFQRANLCSGIYVEIQLWTAQ